MITVARQALVPYGAVEMYELVGDVESYPRFVPWCSAVDVALREAGRTIATLHVNFRGVRQAFTTENLHQRGERISMRLVRGPFSRLAGEWRFAQLGEAGCRIDFELAYEIASPLLERIAGPAFNHMASTFVDAFVRRADALHLRPA
ncbi:MAG: type II toxin-antitoxin system RatA family toxin [Burkholderiales bacterium]